MTNGTGGASGTVSTTTAGVAGILPTGATGTVAGFGGGTFNNTGFQVTFGGTLATTNVPVMLALQDFTAGASGFVGETDKGGAVDNKGGIITPTGNAYPGRDGSGDGYDPAADAVRPDRQRDRRG